MLYNYVGIRGIVTKISIHRPKMISSVHYVNKNDNTEETGTIRNYPDQFDLTKKSE